MINLMSSLNNIDHHDLGFVHLHGVAFGDNINQMLVFPTEFEEIQREYPIFFRRTDGASSPRLRCWARPRRESVP